MSSTETTTPARFVVMVKGANGRKWFRADSAQWADIDTARAGLDDMARTYPHLRFMATNEPGMNERPIAPKRYRPWDTDADETDDVNLDALGDDEL